MTARLLVLCATLVTSPAWAAPAMKGIALGLYPSEATKTGYSYPAILTDIHGVGADHVSLVVHWRQHDVRATSIGPALSVTLPDGQLRQVIRSARERGLRVFLFPILDIEIRRPLEWRGTIAPGNVNAWWAQYERFILHYARIAGEEGVDLLSIGSELGTTETWKERWLHLIAATKKTFRGQLVYSANWDHYDQVSFWDKVDYMGVTAYNELARDNNAPEESLAAAWSRVKHKLVAFATRVGKSIVITEVGYTSQDGAAVHPWDYTSRAAVDLEEQRRCYQAFVTAWMGEQRLAGVFWWSWFGAGGKTDLGYTPRGKPAEQVLRVFYGTPASAARD
jgi:hypothetical protein